MDTIRDICESTLIPNRRKLSNFSARDLADLIFLYILTIQILRMEFETRPFAIDYVKQTTKWGDFKDFKNSGSDLYLLIHILFFSDESDFFILKNQEASKLLRENLYLDTNLLKTWMRGVQNNNNDADLDARFLIKLEQGLNIDTSDYRSIRRLVSNWTALEHKDRQLCITRLLFALRSRAPKSELLPIFERHAKNHNLFLKGSRNPEKNPKDSIGDISRGAVIGGAIGAGLLGAGLINLIKNSTKAKKFTSMKETVSAGATGAGAIAATPVPLFSEPLRRKINDDEEDEKSSKKDK